MEIYKLLNSSLIRLESEAESREEILKEFADMAAGVLADQGITSEEIYSGLYKRETSGSTAFGSGIAVPHCAVENLKNFHLGIMTVKNSIDFHAEDKQGVNFFFFILGPQKERFIHLRILSAVSKFLRENNAHKQLSTLKNPEEIISFFKNNALAYEESEHQSSLEQKIIITIITENKNSIKTLTLGLDSLTESRGVISLKKDKLLSIKNKRLHSAPAWQLRLVCTKHESREILRWLDQLKTNSIIRDFTAQDSLFLN
jgi:PTS system nitrogen regulatory IIA component